jgi:uncharacterized protein
MPVFYPAVNLRPLSVQGILSHLTNVMKAQIMLFLTASSLAAHASSPIDCAKANTPTERTICRTPSLLQADARMTAYFDIATQFVGMGVRGNLIESQQAFPSMRDRCGMDKACIQVAYNKQTAPLEAVIASVKTHGPF